MSESRKMIDVIREEWSIACDGDEMDMANWAIRWGNPLMGAAERRVLNAELQAEVDRLQRIESAAMAYSNKMNRTMEDAEPEYNILQEALQSTD